MVILKTKMKVGPKGQVVIPKQIRDEKKIFPGDVIKGKINPHAYEEELEER